MDQHFKKLLVIVVLVSFIFSSSAYNAASTEEHTSTDIETRSNCEPVSHVCDVPTPDSKPTTEAVTEEDSQDTTGFEPSTDHNERICFPGTTVCNEPKHDLKPTKDAVTDEDASNFKSNSICNPYTGLCQGQYIGDADTVTSPVESSEKENASKSEALPICDPITNICLGPETNPVKDLVCDPITHKCGGPNPQLFVPESGNAVQIEDSVIPEEQSGINFFACITNPDGSRTCQGSHHAFGIAQPKDVAA